MRKLLFVFVLFLPYISSAQYFSEAPKLDRPVKQIIEWKTVPPSGSEKEETFKGGVYDFRRDGKMTTYQSNDSDRKDYVYFYDNKGRLEKVEMNERSGKSSMSYTYSKGIKKAEIKADSLYLVTTHFLDAKGKVVEEKTSGKAPFTGGAFSIISRKVLNYNKKGDLFGEMEYTYVGDKTEARKTLHQYNPADGKKMKTLFYDEFSNLAQTEDFTYSEKGELSKVDVKRPSSDFWVSTEYRRKNGKLWMEVENIHHEGERIEKVYKDGRLVRTKYFSDDELYFYTDYQYFFY